MAFADFAGNLLLLSVGVTYLAIAPVAAEDLDLDDLSPIVLYHCRESVYWEPEPPGASKDCRWLYEGWHRPSWFLDAGICIGHWYDGEQWRLLVKSGYHCNDQPHMHWVLPKGEGPIRVSVSLNMCLQAGPGTAGENGDMMRLSLQACSGHVNQSFIMPSSPVGNICWSGDPDVCLASGVCADYTYWSRPVGWTDLYSKEVTNVVLGPSVLRQGRCLDVDTVMYPWSDVRIARWPFFPPRVRRRFLAALFDFFPWVYSASLALFWISFLAQMCRQRRRAWTVVTHLWSKRFQSPCAKRRPSRASVRLKAMVDRLRAQRCLIAARVLLPGLTLLLHFVAYRIHTAQFLDLSKGIANIDSINRHFFFQTPDFLLFVAWLCLGAMAHCPTLTSGRGVDVIYSSLCLSMALFSLFPNYARQGEFSTNESFWVFALRLMGAVIIGKPGLTACLNIIIGAAACVAFVMHPLRVFHDSVQFKLNTWQSQMEFVILIFVTLVAWFVEVSTRNEAVAILEMKTNQAGKDAVSRVLGGFCDAVVHLDSQHRFVNVGRLPVFLFMSPGQQWSDRDFKDMIVPEDLPRFLGYLRSCELAAGSAESEDTGMIPIRMFDANRVHVRVDLLCSCLLNAEEELSYVLGIQEVSEPGASRHGQGEQEDRVPEMTSLASHGAPLPQPCSEQSACDSHSDASSESYGSATTGTDIGDIVRTARISVDTFEIVGASQGMLLLTGDLPEFEPCLLDYLERPGQFILEFNSALLAAQRPNATGFVRSERPFGFSFPGTRRPNRTALVEIAFNLSAGARLADVKLRSMRSRKQGRRRPGVRASSGEEIAAEDDGVECNEEQPRRRRRRRQPGEHEQLRQHSVKREQRLHHGSSSASGLQEEGAARGAAVSIKTRL